MTLLEFFVQILHWLKLINELFRFIIISNLIHMTHLFFLQWNKMRSQPNVLITVFSYQNFSYKNINRKNNILFFLILKLKNKVQCAAMSSQTSCRSFIWDGSKCSILTGIEFGYEPTENSTYFCYNSFITGKLFSNH